MKKFESKLCSELFFLKSSENLPSDDFKGNRLLVKLWNRSVSEKITDQKVVKISSIFHCVRYRAFIRYEKFSEKLKISYLLIRTHPTNFLSVFDHFVGLPHERLKSDKKSWVHNKWMILCYSGFIKSAYKRKC